MSKTKKILQTVANPGISAYVLSREQSETLEWFYRPQTFALYDKSNRRASITLRWGDALHTFHKLIYTRGFSRKISTRKGT